CRSTVAVATFSLTYRCEGSAGIAARSACAPASQFHPRGRGHLKQVRRVVRLSGRVNRSATGKTSEQVGLIDRGWIIRTRLRILPRFLHAGLSRRSEEHTSELQSRENFVCRLLLEQKNK